MYNKFLTSMERSRVAKANKSLTLPTATEEFTFQSPGLVQK